MGVAPLPCSGAAASSKALDKPASECSPSRLRLPVRTLGHP
jgi:hypothetical protein